MVVRKYLISAGIFTNGNCYSDKICYDAEILPTRKVQELNDWEKTKLYHSIRKILTEATSIGGYMEHPLFVNDKKTGSYNNYCQVYDCAGNLCKKCGNQIVQIELSSKKTFYCSGCQH
jgi:formamidopyrimidine-DNA glycosylase